MGECHYVHDHLNRETLRLCNQAKTLESILHNDSIFLKGNLVLEAGCGVGAQTKIIASKNPDTNFISIDISNDSLKEAKQMTKSFGILNVNFMQADIYNLPFDDESFDNVIVCFVIEHLKNPLQALWELKRVLKKGGVMMVIEADHGLTFFHPYSKSAYAVINCLVQIQKQHGGNSHIGRELCILLQSIGLSNISVSPRVVNANASNPQLRDGFVKNTFITMLEGIKETAIQMGIIDDVTFEKGIKDLYRTAKSNGVFNYTFFKGTAIK